MNMMSLFLLNVIAVVEEETVSNSSTQVIDVSKMVDFFWENITSLPWMVALLIISVGIVYMLYGWRIFRVLVTISFGFLGLFLGIFAGQYIGSIVWGGDCWHGVICFHIGSTGEVVCINFGGDRRWDYYRWDLDCLWIIRSVFTGGICGRFCRRRLDVIYSAQSFSDALYQSWR